MSKSTVDFDESLVNEDMINKFKVTMSPDAIPDIKNIYEQLDEFLLFIESPQMMKIKKENDIDYERVIYNKYNDKLPRVMIRLLLDEENRYENLDRLMDMLDTMDKVKSGKKDINIAYEEFSEKINEKYLYPMFDGKENFNKVISQKK